MELKNANLSIRIDPELKKDAEQLFGQLGMNLSTAFNVFVRQSLRVGGIPFTVSLGNAPAEGASKGVAVNASVIPGIEYSFEAGVNKPQQAEGEAPAEGK